MAVATSIPVEFATLRMTSVYADNTVLANPTEYP